MKSSIKKGIAVFGIVAALATGWYFAKSPSKKDTSDKKTAVTLVKNEKKLDLTPESYLPQDVQSDYKIFSSLSATKQRELVEELEEKLVATTTYLGDHADIIRQINPQIVTLDELISQESPHLSEMIRKREQKELMVSYAYSRKLDKVVVVKAKPDKRLVTLLLEGAHATTMKAHEALHQKQQHSSSWHDFVTFRANLPTENGYFTFDGESADSYGRQFMKKLGVGPFEASKDFEKKQRDYKVQHREQKVIRELHAYMLAPQKMGSNSFTVPYIAPLPYRRAQAQISNFIMIVQGYFVEQGNSPADVEIKTAEWIGKNGNTINGFFNAVRSQFDRAKANSLHRIGRRYTLDKANSVGKIRDASKELFKETMKRYK